jgi:ABC-type dipeptide/oligopeptide/nickel transport system ATPase component
MPTEEVLQKILWENNIEDKAYLEFAKDFHFKNIIPIAAEVIFNKHCAILGSSGCGKSNTVAKIIEEFVEHTDSNKKIILIDPTGEYGEITDKEKMENIEKDFYIDRQHVSLEDLCFYLNPSSQVQYPVLAEAVDKWKKNSNSSLTESVISVVKDKKDQSTYCQTLIMRLSRLEGIGVNAISKVENKQNYTDYKIRTNENIKSWSPWIEAKVGALTDLDVIVNKNSNTIDSVNKKVFYL